MKVAAGLYPQKAADFMYEWVDNYHMMFDYESRLPWTQSQGDHSQQNLFYPVNRLDEVRIVDWQWVQKGTPAADVARLITDGISLGMSTDLESSLVKNYLETLERCGYESFDYADFEMEYCLQLAGSLEGIFSHVVIAPEPEALKVRPLLEELCRVLTSITL